MASVTAEEFAAYRNDMASRLMKLESYVNNKFMEVEGQQQQNIVELGNIKGTQSAAQQNLTASIEEELEKKSQHIAELQNHTNQTLEDIKKEFQAQERN